MQRKTNLPKIAEGLRKWADEERAFWHAEGIKARNTDIDYDGKTWVGFYAFHEGKEG